MCLSHLLNGQFDGQVNHPRRTKAIWEDLLL